MLPAFATHERPQPAPNDLDICQGPLPEIDLRLERAHKRISNKINFNLRTQQKIPLITTNSLIYLKYFLFHEIQLAVVKIKK